MYLQDKEELFQKQFFFFFFMKFDLFLYLVIAFMFYINPKSSSCWALRIWLGGRKLNMNLQFDKKVMKS